MYLTQKPDTTQHHLATFCHGRRASVCDLTSHAVPHRRSPLHENEGDRDDEGRLAATPKRMPTPHAFGVQVVGCPKTVDNALSAADTTFGYDTAVFVATEAIDKLRTTARSHERVIVVEVMGRHAVWTTWDAGLGRERHPAVADHATGCSSPEL